MTESHLIRADRQKASRKPIIVGAALGVLAGAAVAFPLGAASSSEPEAETKEVLPAACADLLDGVSDHMSIFSNALRVASDYPLIISELAPAAAYGDNATLRDLVDRMETNEAELVRLHERQETLNLGDKIDRCSAYR